MARQSKDNEGDPLLIDRAAAAELPTAEALREWGRDKRVFISSVMGELAEERKAVAAGLRQEGIRPVMFEEFGGRDADPHDAYVAEVEGADIYLGILGRTYGLPLKTRYSATHTEYLHAEKHGLRIAMWASETDHREGHEQAFLNEARVFYVVPLFRDSADLTRQVTERMRAIAAEDLAPWCKLGNLIFRASLVEDHGETITVTSRVRNDAVAHALEGLRADQWNRPPEQRFTWCGRSKYVKPSAVQVKTTSSRSRLFQLTLEATDDPRDSLEYNMNGMSPDDMTEKALRIVLFGEANPFDASQMGFALEIKDPFQPLRDGSISEESIRPLAELCLADVLVGNKRASRLTEFRLGVSVRGVRSLVAGWETPRRYSNERTALRSITGEVKL